MGVRLPDTAGPMGDFPGMMAEHIAFADGERLQEKLDNGGLGGSGASYTQLSQAEYDALTEDEKMNGKEYRTYDTGHIYKLGVEYGKDADISRSEVLTTYVSIGDLNSRKGTSISLVANEDNTQTLIDALDAKEQFVDWFGNSNDRFGINPKTYGGRINEFRVTKLTNTDASITAIMNSGAVLSRVYTGGTLGDWVSTGHILNDGYTDDGTIAITGQSEDSTGMYGNGVLPETLGFTRDVMTWDNGIYRISHGNDTLIGLPENLQSGRLEHFNLKRWQGNHNPHTKDWAERMSIFYSMNGNIYTRTQVSGATAGTLYSDTGWRKIGLETITTLAELGLTSSATLNDAYNKLGVGQTALLSVQDFDNYQTLFPYSVDGDKYARVEIHKGLSAAHSRVMWFLKNGSRMALGNVGSGNTIVGWVEYTTKDYVDSKIADLQAQIDALK